MMVEQQSAVALETELVKAIVNILESTNSPAIQQAREVIAHRLAISGDLAPSRIPAPRNITEIGGYINLLTEYGEDEQRSRMVAAALGIAGPRVNLPQPGTLPPLAFVEREQLRPEGPAQPSLPLNFTMRSDFVGAFDQALGAIAATGGAMPVVSPLRVLPPIGTPVTDAEMQLELIGRRLTLAPTAGLSDPDADPLSLSRPAGGGGFSVLARVLDTEAPEAEAIETLEWISWSCTPELCEEVATTDQRIDLTPLLNMAGWHQLSDLQAPVSTVAQGNWGTWFNITGLVPGQTRFGDELNSIYSGIQILASSVRDDQDLIWDGAAFA
jgi:hypothetical protein